MQQKQNPSFPINLLNGSLPLASIGPDADKEAALNYSLEKLARIQETDFFDGALWRDLYALTSTFRTISGPKAITTAWGKLFDLYRPQNFRLLLETLEIVNLGQGEKTCSWIQGSFTFDTSASTKRICSGTIRIVSAENSDWRIWMLVTFLENIEGFGNVDSLEPGIRGNSLETRNLGFGSRNSSSDTLREQFCSYDMVDCLVIGAGHAGLSVAARLKALGVTSVVLEQNSQVGQNWSSRYHSLTLHSPIRYSELVFGADIYSKDLPDFISNKDVAKALQIHAEKHSTDVRTSAHIDSAKWLEDENIWVVSFTQQNGSCQMIAAPHLVLAVGNGAQTPRYPNIANQADFRGELLHAVDYTSSAGWEGKRGVVIGAANTAHDIANDMVIAGLESVTMVQRSPTMVLSMDPKNNLFSSVYNDERPIEAADRAWLGPPTAIKRLTTIFRSQSLPPDHPHNIKLDALGRAGFQVDRQVDLWKCLYERLGGHHVDVGVAERIIDGSIKVKSDSQLTGFTPTGLSFEDGSKLDADVIVFATGFVNNTKEIVADIVGQEIAENLEDWYGLDDEGELRGAWRDTGHPALWYAGGDFAHVRFYSRFLALHIKGRLAGIEWDKYMEKL